MRSFACVRGLILGLLWLMTSTPVFTQDTLSPYDTLINSSIKLIEKKEFDQAKNKLYAALEVYPEGVESNYFLGYCYAKDCTAKKENCKLGISFLSKAINLEEGFRNPYFQRAICKFALKDFTGALADIDQQIELNSSDPAYFLLRANIYYSIDNTEGVCNNLEWYFRYGGRSEVNEVVKKLEAFCKE